MTPMQKKEMEDDIYRLQTRVLQLESMISNNRVSEQKVGEQHHKSIASTSSDVERLNIEVKRMKGDIDALRVGVQTGQMPGQEGSQEGSVGAQLAEIKARLDAVEATQKDLMSALEKGGTASTHDKSASRKPDAKSADKKESLSGNADAASVQAAFERKHFKEVVEDAPSALKKAKGKDREQVLMAYGESLMRLNRPKEAALQFNEVVELKPTERNMAIAKLRLGDAFKSMGDKDTSKLFYEEVASKYGNTPEGEKAKKALKAKK
jgi:TolA-binding protein